MKIRVPIQVVFALDFRREEKWDDLQSEVSVR